MVHLSIDHHAVLVYPATEGLAHFRYGDAMTDGQIPNQLDNETLARLRDGSATAADEIAKREAWLAVAKDYGDNSRVAVLEAQLEQLRRG